MPTLSDENIQPAPLLLPGLQKTSCSTRKLAKIPATKSGKKQMNKEIKVCGHCAREYTGVAKTFCSRLCLEANKLTRGKKVVYGEPFDDGREGDVMDIRLDRDTPSAILTRYSHGPVDIGLSVLEIEYSIELLTIALTALKGKE